MAQGPGRFSGVTSYRADYPRRELQPLYRHQPEKYHASTRPMDTVPLYRESYVAHCAPPARTCRPPPLPPVTAPLSQSTEHRDRYLGEALEVCPAVPLLQRVPGCALPAVDEGRPRRCETGRFRYRDRDEVGHEWYTYEENSMPAPIDIVYDPYRYVPGNTAKTSAKIVAAARAVHWAPPAPPSSLPVDS